MPYYSGKDKQGNWVKWGKNGKKYHYPAGNMPLRKAAQSRAKNSAKPAKRPSRGRKK